MYLLAAVGLCCGAKDSHSSGFSCGKAWAPGHGGFSGSSVGLSNCSSWALEHGLSSRGEQALVAHWHVESSWSRD